MCGCQTVLTRVAARPVLIDDMYNVANFALLVISGLLSIQV